MGNKEILPSDFNAESLPLYDPNSKEFSRRFSRRQLLRGSAVVAVASWLGREPIARIAAAVYSQIDAKRRSNVSNDEFLWNNREKLKNVRLGCTFTPEKFDIYSSTHHYDEDSRYKDAFAALRIAVEILGIRDIRLGLRMDNISRDGKTIDFAYYRPFINYCLKMGVNVTFCLGAIKTPGWDEQHQSDGFLESLTRLPAWGERISGSSELGQKAIKYKDRLCRRLLYEYGKQRSVQGTNEPFQKYGEFGWTVDKEYIKNAAEVFNNYFPKATILFNSAGFLNLREIHKTLSYLKQEVPSLNGRLFIGIDYYSEHPSIPRFPILGRPDPILLGQVLLNDPFDWIRKSGYPVGISEAQWETWLEDGRPVLTAPSKDDKAFKFTLLRGVENILSEEGGPIMLWGLEEQASDMMNGLLTDGQVQNVDLIQRINFRPRPLRRVFEGDSELCNKRAA